LYITHLLGESEIMAHPPSSYSYKRSYHLSQKLFNELLYELSSSSSLAANSSEPYLWIYLFPNSHYSLEKLSLMSHNDSKKTRRI